MNSCGAKLNPQICPSNPDLIAYVCNSDIWVSHALTGNLIIHYRCSATKYTVNFGVDETKVSHFRHPSISILETMLFLKLKIRTHHKMDIVLQHFRKHVKADIRSQRWPQSSRRPSKCWNPILCDAGRIQQISRLLVATKKYW